MIASDGYEYEDLTQRLLGRPLDNQRNLQVRSIRRFYPQNEAGAFVEAYDKRCGEHPSKYDAGWRAVADERDRTRDPAR